MEAKIPFYNPEDDKPVELSTEGSGSGGGRRTAIGMFGAGGSGDGRRGFPTGFGDEARWDLVRRFVSVWRVRPPMRQRISHLNPLRDVGQVYKDLWEAKVGGWYIDKQMELDAVLREVAITQGCTSFLRSVHNYALAEDQAAVRIIGFPELKIDLEYKKIGFLEREADLLGFEREMMGINKAWIERTGRLKRPKAFSEDDAQQLHNVWLPEMVRKYKLIEDFDVL